MERSRGEARADAALARLLHRMPFPATRSELIAAADRHGLLDAETLGALERLDEYEYGTPAEVVGGLGGERTVPI